MDLADIHGQDAFNFRHATISRDQSRRFLAWAFRRDFERNGPSLFRICRTTFAGWKRHKNHADPRVRERIRRESRMLRHAYPASLWAIEHQLQSTNREAAARVRVLRKELEREFGVLARLASLALGPVLWFTSWLEERRSARGKTYNPSVIVDRKNWPLL